MQTAKVCFEVFAVVLPRHAVHPRRGLGLKRPVGSPQALDVDVVQERGEPRILVRCAIPRTRSSSLGALSRALSPERVLLAAFPLAGPLPSTASAAPPWALFGSFPGSTRPSDFSRSSITGLRPRPSPRDPPFHHHRRVTVRSPGSRHEEITRMLGVPTPRGPLTARQNAARDVAFRVP